MQRRLILATLLLAPSWALAHEPRVGPHGGVLVDAGPFHVEITATGANLEVFVSDAQDKPLPAAGFKGTAVLVMNGKPHRVALEATRPDRLTGQAAVAIGAPLKGVILLTSPDGKTANAKLE